MSNSSKGKHPLGHQTLSPSHSACPPLVQNLAILFLEGSKPLIWEGGSSPYHSVMAPIAPAHSLLMLEQVGLRHWHCPQTEKDYFKDALESFIISSNQALNNPNPKESCLKWKKHLGDRFPCHLAKDEIEGAKTYGAAPIKNDNSRSAQK